MVAGLSSRTTLPDHIERWLPGQLLTAVGAGGNDTASDPTACLTPPGYAAIAISITLWSFQRQDAVA